MKAMIRWLAYSPTNVRRGLLLAGATFVVVMVSLSVAANARDASTASTVRTPDTTTSTSSRGFTPAGSTPATPRPGPTSAAWAKPSATVTTKGEQDEAATGKKSTEKAAEDAARGFVRAWLAGRSTPKQAWVAKVLPLTHEPSMKAALEATDPNVLPKAKLGATTNVDAGAFLAGVDVELTDGQTVHLDVMLEQGRWVVYNYGPARE